MACMSDYWLIQWQRQGGAAEGCSIFVQRPATTDARTPSCPQSPSQQHAATGCDQCVLSLGRDAQKEAIAANICNHAKYSRVCEIQSTKNGLKIIDIA